MKKTAVFISILFSLVFTSVSAVSADITDTYYDRQMNLQQIQYEYAWDSGLDGRGVRVAIIDSGIYSENEDIDSMRIIPGVNLLDRSSDTYDTGGHGTFIAGMLGASRNNGLGIAGMVDKAYLVPLKCFSADKQTDSTYIVSAIYMAVDEYKCDVINMSLGISDDIPALKQAVEYAASKGVIIVASVGNTGGTSLMYPASYNEVIGVGSVSIDNKPSRFSQRNSSVFVVAPGEEIISTGIYSENSYMDGSGTSFSSVHVTALAAIAKQHNNSIGIEEFKQLLINSSTDLGTQGYDTTYGWGLINVPEYVDLLTYESISFSDISSHWAKDYIYDCVDLGLFSGVGNNLFMPNSPMSRAMAATVLYRLDSEPYIKSSSGLFSDVPSDIWFEDPVAWAYNSGIVSGLGNSMFAPNKNITREELAVMLYRYAAYRGFDTGIANNTAFKDSADISFWAKDAVSWTSGNGIVGGRPDGTFAPNSAASRAEVAAVLVRFSEIHG